MPNGRTNCIRCLCGVLLAAALLCLPGVRPVRASEDVPPDPSPALAAADTGLAADDETPDADTFMPGFTASVVEGYIGLQIVPESLREYIAYDGALTLSYAVKPDWSKRGYQAAALLIRDGAGHSFVQPFTVLLKPDTVKPVLYGVHKIYAYLDETIVYMDGIRAEDNADPAPVITVDTSKVNIHMAGNYKIVYTATDFSGNSRSEEAVVTLMTPKYSAEKVHTLAVAVLDKITTPDMTVTEKLRAIFDWGRSHIKYGLGCGHADRRRAAVMGFEQGKGDCFSFYACTCALLDEIGVDYVSVERLGGKSRHYWVLVNVGTGWYHFDTTVSNNHKHKCFMWTDEQCQVKAYFWRYDHSRYPVTVATEPFDYEAQVAREKAAQAD